MLCSLLVGCSFLVCIGISLLMVWSVNSKALVTFRRARFHMALLALHPISPHKYIRTSQHVWNTIWKKRYLISDINYDTFSVDTQNSDPIMMRVWKAWCELNIIVTSVTIWRNVYIRSFILLKSVGLIVGVGNIIIT